ncbi:MAG: hypothetical protein WED87_08010 [Dehalococcoidia bacterium]
MNARWNVSPTTTRSPGAASSRRNRNTVAALVDMGHIGINE